MKFSFVGIWAGVVFLLLASSASVLAADVALKICRLNWQYPGTANYNDGMVHVFCGNYFKDTSGKWTLDGVHAATWIDVHVADPSALPKLTYKQSDPARRAIDSNKAVWHADVTINFEDTFKVAQSAEKKSSSMFPKNCTRDQIEKSILAAIENINKANTGVAWREKEGASIPAPAPASLAPYCTQDKGAGPVAIKIKIVKESSTTDTPSAAFRKLKTAYPT